MVQHFKLPGFVIAYDENTKEVGAYVEFRHEDNDGESSFTTLQKSYLEDDTCLHIGPWKIRKDSPFATKDEYRNFYNNLPVWNKTKYYAIGDNYYSCLDSKEVAKQEVYS